MKTRDPHGGTPHRADQSHDHHRRTCLQRLALGAGCLAASPLVASPRLVDAFGEPFAATHVNPLAGPADDAYATLRDALLASLNLVPVVGGFLSYLGALFIPAAGESPEAAWRKYTNERISESLFATVRSDLIGMSDVAGLYRNAVASGDVRALHAQSIAANTVFTALIPRFQISSEEVNLLPLFSIAASLHLALLRDMTLKGKDLGFQDAYIAGIAADLAARCMTYAAHADRCVAKAIEKARQDHPYGPTPDQRNQPFSAMLQARTNLQDAVIDQRDTWYAFDALRFPGPVQVTLSREVMTPVIGWWDATSRPPTTLPDWPAPKAPLQRIHVWNRRQFGAVHLSGFRAVYGDGSELATGDLSGDMSTLDLIATHAHVDRVESYSAAAIGGMQFRTQPGGRQHLYGAGPDRFTRTLTSAFPRHRLSSIRSIGKGNDAVAGLVSGVVLGFQLIDPQARPLSLEAFRQMAPNVAPQLLEWIAD